MVEIWCTHRAVYYKDPMCLITAKLYLQQLREEQATMQGVVGVLRVL